MVICVDARCQHLDTGTAVKTDLPTQGIVKTLNQLNHSALATPTWTNESNRLAFVDLKVDAIQNLTKTKE